MKMSFMSKFNSKNQKQIITTFDLGNMMQHKKIIPTPSYEKDKEYRFIVQKRGSIFSSVIKRSKPPRF